MGVSSDGRMRAWPGYGIPLKRSLFGECVVSSIAVSVHFTCSLRRRPEVRSKQNQATETDRSPQPQT
ncbi:hypothetical protein LSAT2_014600 [Lamellibrachia satsuma]|nr:hypothetical protein LSAT2_014600 [Lamellibrachia satsuma]